LEKAQLERRLAAIFAADMARYEGPIGADDEGRNLFRDAASARP